MPKAIFLDRDGVLNEERGEYSFKPEDIHILVNVPEGLARLKEAGFKLIVITNQGGIAKRSRDRGRQRCRTLQSRHSRKRYDQYA